MPEGAVSIGACEVLSETSPVLLHQFFFSAVRRWPDRTAVEIPPGHGRPDRRSVTYAELGRQADAVAGALRGLVGRDSIVAILLPRRSEWLYSSQLGTLKAGGAYACIDPAFPDGRIREIMEDAWGGPPGLPPSLPKAGREARPTLLTDAEGAARARGIGFGGRILVVDELEDSLAAPSESLADPGSLAYVIYTSGTTGRPKGVMIEHRSIVNLVASDIEEFRLTPDARVSQNSSPAYDSSIEEIWLAFAAGAALVVVDDETVRLGPDLIEWLRRERITVFCPPPTLLRATACEDPEAELPELGFIYTGGEVLPQDLADRWSKGKLLVNGYGPTECAVTATRAYIHPGEPVSIGRPVPGLHAWVLNDSLEEVAEGQWGELCLGGIGLARGYRNRPEETAERFVSHPRFGRIYRTGDLVHRAADGSYFYHGRADTQVKIRGYRVELEEIETRLAAWKGVRSAACAVQDGALAAFIVPENGWEPKEFGPLEAALRETLPDYMVPNRFGILRELPVTTGGKLDRAALPRLNGQPGRKVGAAPRNPLEARLAEVFRDVLGLSKAVAIDADFFIDLGGNSLRAAQVVTRLRQDDAATPVTVRDIYEGRTVAGVAARIVGQTFEGAEGKPGGLPHLGRPGGLPHLATLIQAVWLLAAFSAAAMVGYWGVFDLAPSMMLSMGLIPSLLLAPVLFFAGLAVYTPLSVLAAAAVKRCLIGRYLPLRAPVWGSFYVRNWLVQQAVRGIPWWLIEGTGFQTMALRALGARIGQRVHIHRGVDLRQGGWDLLDIGDDVTIGQEAIVGLVELEYGDILIRPVSLGDGAMLDIRSGVSGGARLEAGACLSALSWLPPGGIVPSGERWDGIPAKPAGYAPTTPQMPAGQWTLLPWKHDVLMALARGSVRELPAVILELCAAVAAMALGLDAGRISRWLDNPTLQPAMLLTGLALVTLSVPLTLALEALMVRAMGRVPEGVIGRWSLAYLRVRMKTEMLEAAGYWLAGALFWPVWLRWAGMKVGRRCEISTILDTVPEMVEIGDGTFLADGIYVGGPRVCRGTVTLAATRLGSGVYLGNHVVIPAGSVLPDNVLLGVCTVVGENMRDGRSWFGHPPFELPRREVVECDRRLTYNPSFIRYATRLFWELMRFTLPIPPMLAALLWLRAASAATTAGGWLLVSAAVCLAALAAEALLCFLAVGVKWSLLGRVRPGQHPFWACWCGRWDFLYVAWEAWARPTLSHLEGTLLLSWYLRAMGMKLGKRVVLGPGFAQVVDPDMLIIEDGATVTSMFQAHTFEDRVLKMDYIHVRRGATLGYATVPLYGADIGAGAYVAPHSVVMKDERLLAGIRYEGAPTRVVGRPLQEHKESPSIDALVG
ncbi:MAG: amino acid adenylation domain-containing protein [Bryobacteraceae bacterium]